MCWQANFKDNEECEVPKVLALKCGALLEEEDEIFEQFIYVR